MGARMEKAFSGGDGQDGSSIYEASLIPQEILPCPIGDWELLL